MRPVLRLLALLLVLFAALPVARADSYVDQSALDELFAELRRAQTPAEADALSKEIWSYWLHPDIPALDRRMQIAASQMRTGDLPHALFEYSSIIRDFPDYAEGWNQRATLYFMMNDLDKSLEDIARVLSLEPRHFGALSGRAMIYLKQGKRQQAMRDIILALSIHPFLAERKLFPDLAPPVTYI